MRLIFLLLGILYWQPTEVKFFYKGSNYQFELPDSDYKLTETNYTEGTYRIYAFRNGNILLHTGGAVRKPILRGRDYIIEETKEVDGKLIRTGHNRKTKLKWCELTTFRNEITLLFENVDETNLKQFQRTIGSLKVLQTK